MNDDIVRRLIMVIAEHLGRDEDSINLETRFIEDLGIDDIIAASDLALEVEDEFDVDIPEENFDELLTVKAVADFIEEEIEKQAI